MKTKFNGKRLNLARTLRKMTLAELGEKVSLSKQSLSLYENNKSTPDFLAMQKLSNVLHFPIDYFFQNNQSELKSGATYFRSLNSTSKKSREAEKIKVEFICSLYKSLYNYIEFPPLNLPKITFDNVTINDESIENIANLLREYWSLGSGPIEDIQTVFESNGIVITGFESIDEKIDAYSQKVEFDGKETYIIVLCLGKKGRARLNFDLAHELGHIILHPWTEDIETLSKEDFKERERQANKFASAFLLPKSKYLTDCKKYPTNLDYYVRLKKKWSVSIQAMIYRSWSLEVITNSQYQYLMRQISRKGWRKNEPGDIPYRLNESIFKMAIDFLLENGFDIKDVAQIFEKSSIQLYNDEIERLLNLPKGYLEFDDENKDNKIIKFSLNDDTVI